MRSEGGGYDPRPVLETLDRHGVAYVVIGGIAARIHGARSPTFDIDVVPERSADNLGRLAAALNELDARLRVGGTDEDVGPIRIDGALLAAWQMSTWSTAHGPLDVLADVPASGRLRLDYQRLLERADSVEVEKLVIYVMGLDDLIESKRAVGRPKDLDTVHELDELRRRESSG